MKKFLVLLTILVIGVMITLENRFAHADIVLELTPNPVTISGATTIRFGGTITNTDLANPITIDGSGLLVPDYVGTNDLFATFTPVTLPANSIRHFPDLFELFVSTGTPSFTGRYDVVDYSIFDPITQFPLTGSAEFRVNIVPEPGTLGVWAGSVLCIGVFLRRRRYQRQ